MVIKYLHTIQKKIFYFTGIISIFISLLIFSCERSFEPVEIMKVERLHAIHIDWDNSNSVVCFGTSLTYGFIWNDQEPDWEKEILIPHTLHNILLNKKNFDFYSQADSAYPHCLNKKLKLRVYNQGHVGITAEQALYIVQDSVLSLNPALILLEIGANDFLRDKNVLEVKAQIDSIINIIRIFGSKLVLVSFVDQYTVEHPPLDHPLYDIKDLAKIYFQMLSDLSKTNNILLIKDCFLGIFGNKNYMSDDVHPNEPGYIKMAENITESLINTFKSNCMLKNE
jgi:acyl-CoA thioesterase-1